MDKDVIVILLSIFLLISVCINLVIFKLYIPQASIVLHDYGQVFESEIDWKIWRIEHYESIS